MNLFKPIMVIVNNAIVVINRFAKAVGDSLGKILGWKYEVGSGAIAMDGVSDSVDDLGGGLGKAGKAAKELKKQLQGFDELNNLSLDDNNGGGGSGGSGSGVGGGSAADMAGEWVKTESLFESDWDTWFKLGRGISEAWTEGLNSIPWDSVYEGARNFGTGLAEFLNGLITPELFGAVGRTIAGSLNTAIYAALAFGQTLDWTQMGEAIASGINNFFSTWDYKATAQAINTWREGIFDMLNTSITGINWSEIGTEIGKFINEIDWGNLVLDLTELAMNILVAIKDGLLAIGEENPLAAGIIGVLLAIKFTNKLNSLASGIAGALGLGIQSEASVSILSKGFSTLFKVGGTIFAVVAAAIAGWNLGQLIYDQLPTDENGDNAIDRYVETTANYWLGDKTTPISDSVAANRTFKNKYEKDILAGGGNVFDVMKLSTQYTQAYNEAMRAGSSEIDALNYALKQLTPELNKYGITVDSNRKQTDDLTIADKKQQKEIKNLKNIHENFTKGLDKNYKQPISNIISGFKNLAEKTGISFNSMSINANKSTSETEKSLNNLNIKGSSAVNNLSNNTTTKMAGLATYIQNWSNSTKNIVNNTKANASFGVDTPSTSAIQTIWTNLKSIWSNPTSTKFNIETPSGNDVSTWWSNLKNIWANSVTTKFNVETPSGNDVSTWWTNLKNIWNKPTSSTFSVETPTGNQVDTWWTNLKKIWTRPTETKFGIEPESGNNVSTWWNNLSSIWRDKDAKFSLAFDADAGSVSSILGTVGQKMFEAFSNVPILSNIASTVRSKIRGYATGGVFDEPTLGIFGEAGAEAVVPLERNLGWLGKMSTLLANEMQSRQYTPPTYTAPTYNGSPYQMSNTYNNNNAEAVREQNALLREQNALLRQIADKDVSISSRDVFNAVKQENNDYVNRTGNSPFIV